jgi:hypothetical protein
MGIIPQSILGWKPPHHTAKSKKRSRLVNENQRSLTYLVNTVPNSSKLVEELVITFRLFRFCQDPVLK